MSPSRYQQDSSNPPTARNTPSRISALSQIKREREKKLSARNRGWATEAPRPETTTTTRSRAGTKGAEGEGRISADYFRDEVTGRALAYDGDSCLRCIEKGLRCTLNYAGVEGEDKCSACRRATTNPSPRCIRQLAPSRRTPFRGKEPWQNPNFFCLGDPQPSKLEMQEILRTHFLGGEEAATPTYRHGTYARDADRRAQVLPPFNGTDMPLAQRPANWKTADWRTALPAWKNRSLHARPILLDRENGARPANAEEIRQNAPEFVSEDATNYMRVVRRLVDT
ncbi:uncharacterized protein GGS25DRAFT_106607 [Hypoxylon fragiforme]|uniref:uncharacterized protein n=1 Tax=Hypoxylon fragiforme TaxID=63214 RepID=UPI0020C65A32|nr:uncharacterized protein GGS25DRAFT_106607 [Hypoxylon fragiforme]KAI2612117.1 hypothetical protein GGS25DRAFT_106607 [Hypoxylon fragiforme]